MSNFHGVEKFSVGREPEVAHEAPYHVKTQSLLEEICFAMDTPSKLVNQADKTGSHVRLRIVENLDRADAGAAFRTLENG